MIDVYIVTVRRPDDPALSSLVARLASDECRPIIVPSIIGPQLSAGEYFQLLAPYYQATGRLMTPGEIGCSLGHRLAWQQIRASTEPCSVVLEDDALLDGSFRDRVAMLMAHPVTSTAFVSFGAQEGLDRHTHQLRGRTVPDLPDTWEVFPPDLPKLFRTAGYMISPALADRLASAADRALFVADDFRWLYCSGTVRRFVLSNVIGHPVDLSLSSIQRERQVVRKRHAHGSQPLLRRILTKVGLKVKLKLAARCEAATWGPCSPIPYISRFAPGGASEHASAHAARPSNRSR